MVVVGGETYTVNVSARRTIAAAAAFTAAAANATVAAPGGPRPRT
jgi:hypothetical protein